MSTENGAAIAETNEVQPATDIAPPAPPKHPAYVGKLTREEFLEIENLSIKTQNIAMQEKQLQQDLIQANKMRNELQGKLTEQHKSLSAKYGVDVLAQSTKILEDGTILDMTRIQQQRSPGAAPGFPVAKPGN